MAIDCIAKFKDESTTIRFLSANQPYNGTIASQFDGAFFKFELIENESVFFTLRVQPNTTQPINVVFTLYKKVGDDYITLGSSVSDDFYNSFSYAATPAEYYICIQSDWSVNYTLEADFTDYPFVSIADCDAYAGEYIPPIEFARRESVCDSAVFYQIVGGRLPTGLSLNADGIIEGVPVEQDCEPEAKDLPPSFTWFEETEDGVKSTSCEYTVVIRAALVDSPETYVDREFKICVHNNWDFDRDNFLAQRDKWETPVFVKPEDEPRLELVVPEPEPTPSELLSKPLCETEEVVEEIKYPTIDELKELAKQVHIKEEYQGLVKINDEGLCEVCEQEEPEEQEIKLEEIKVEYCEPCPEPVVIEGLKELPETLCPVEVEEIQVEDIKPQLAEGIPLVCYPELLKRMFTEKVCSGRPQCPDNNPIYPELDINKDKILKSQCNSCED